MRKNSILSKKIIKNLENSIKFNSLELDFKYLEEHNFYNVEIEEYYAEEFKVRGELKIKIINILLNTFWNWKSQLDQLNGDYYLAIWLYIPRILKSEVVCAIEDKIQYYNNEALMSAKSPEIFNTDQFGNLSNKLRELQWKHKIDIEPHFDWEMNWPADQYENIKEYFKDKRKYKRIINENFHSIEKDGSKIYFEPKGDIWVGELK